MKLARTAAPPATPLRRPNSRWLAVTAAVTLACLLPVQAADPAAVFDSANKLYEQGKFAEAAAVYGQIIQSGRASAPLYFNLGNTFFKDRQIGRAILAYGRAKAITPRDPDVLANLRFARNQVQGPTFSPPFLSRWLGKLSLNEWTLAAAVAAWGWLLLLTIPRWRPTLRPALRGWTYALGIVVALFATCLGARCYQLRFQPTAVIVVPEALLRQAPFPESPSPVTLYDGAEVRVMDRRDDWLQVSTDPRRIGWVHRDQAVLAP